MGDEYYDVVNFRLSKPAEFTTPEETGDHDQWEINLNFLWRVNFWEGTVLLDDGLMCSFSIGMSRLRFLCVEELRAVMDCKLRAFLDDRDLRIDVADGLREMALESVGNNIPADNGVFVDFYFDVVVDRRRDSFDDEEEFIGDVDVQGNCCMIPAADSSIESLKAVAAAVCDSGDRIVSSCLICLEDIDLYSGGGGDCEALCMPCSHVYHADCIKKWLSTSHYCPLCRFEMPTTTDLLDI